MSHGPATLPDFVWWSGLTTTEAQAGLDMAQTHLVKEEAHGKTYWLPASIPAVKHASPTTYLLPAYDEYLVAYKDRSDAFNSPRNKRVNLGNPIVIDGQVGGSWKRVLKKNAVAVETSLFVPLQKAETQALEDAAERYGRFMNMPVLLAQVE